MKILIADDNPQVRAVVREYLPAAADEVYECGDGAAAVALYKKYLPDWVLMDWEMPNTNGVAAIRQIVAEFPRARICMVTAFDDDDIRKAAFAAGAVGFVLKDNLSELETILH